MTAQSIVCGTCTAEVPYGRLSCPSCGELLASVSRRRRHGSPTARRSPTAVVPRTPRESSLRTEPRSADPLREASPAWQERPPIDDPVPAHDVEAELPWVALDGYEDAREPDQDGARYAFWPSTEPLAGPATPPYMPRRERAQRPAERGPHPGTAAAPTLPPPSSYAPTDPAAYRTGGFAGPGAYVPPDVTSMNPAGPAAPARAWRGQGGDGRLAAVAPPRETPRSAATDLGSPARVAEFVGWLSVAGAAFASVGFLLPWGPVMIGSSGVGYFDRWGLAGPAHVVVVVGLLALLALGLARTDVAVRIRTGIGGLGLGALVLGLVWPYVVGPLGSGPGAQIVGIGALALVMSGLLAIVVDRGDPHVEVDRSL